MDLKELQNIPEGILIFVTEKDIPISLKYLAVRDGESLDILSNKFLSVSDIEAWRFLSLNELVGYELACKSLPSVFQACLWRTQEYLKEKDASIPKTNILKRKLTKLRRLFLFLSALFSPRRSLFSLLAFIWVLTLSSSQLALAFLIDRVPISLTLQPLFIISFILSIPISIISISYSFTVLSDNIVLHYSVLLDNFIHGNK